MSLKSALMQIQQEKKEKEITEKIQTMIDEQKRLLGEGVDISKDDVQSPDDVSAIGLRNTIQSYQDVLYSRSDNPAINFRIVLQQRCHENDISGYLTSNHPDSYEHICLPVILTDDIKPTQLIEMYTQQGGYFWPTRFSQKVLDDFRSTMRTSMYAGQLLQRPTLEEGEIILRSWFKTIKLSEIINKNIEYSLVLDPAYTDRTINDPTGILVVGKYNNQIVIRKAYQKWLQFHELIHEIQELHKVFNIKRIYIEGKASGLSLIQQLKSQTNLNVITINPGSRDKMSRVQSITPQLEAEKVVLVEDEWNDLFLSECAGFPYSVHDDLVDCLSYAVGQLTGGSGVTVFKTIAGRQTTLF